MNTRDPSLMKSFKEHKDSITQCIFSHNMKQIISSSMDGMVLATSLKANSRANKFQGHLGPVYDVSINPSNSLIASCSRDNTIRIWNNTASARSVVLKGHSAPVKSIEFNADGSLLVSASDDKLIKMWSAADQKFLQTFSGHQNWVKSAQFSADSRMVASGSDDKTVRIWDVADSGKQIHMFTDHTGMVNDVKFHPDSTCLASCGTDRKIKIYDCRSHRLLQHYDAHDDTVNSVSFNQGGTHLISTSNDGCVKIWDLRRGCILYTLYGHEGATTAASFSPAGDYFLSGGADNNILCWRSFLNPSEAENINEISAKIETEVFVTQKERVDKLPTTRGTKVGNVNKHKKTGSLGQQLQAFEQETELDQSKSQMEPQLPSQQVVGGLTFRHLSPEAKMTLEKIVYQLELVGKTLQLLESRIIDSEDKLQEVMTFIKHNDLEYQPEVVNKVLSMNRYDEVTGTILDGESPEKKFGMPLPGDPSIMYTIQKNQLAQLQSQFANTVSLLQPHIPPPQHNTNGPNTAAFQTGTLNSLVNPESMPGSSIGNVQNSEGMMSPNEQFQTQQHQPEIVDNPMLTQKF